MDTKYLNKNFSLIIMGLLIGFLNGVLGSGGGIFAVLMMTHILKRENKIAHATSISIILPLCIISAFMLIKNGYYDLALYLKVALGTVIGGAIGAKILCKISNKLIKRIFGVVMVFSAVRMLF